MATANIYAGEDSRVDKEAGLGIGFFGIAGFGASVDLNEFNGRTFVSSPSGITEGFECNNCKWLSSARVISGQEGSGILLTQLPNSLATVNMRFEHTTAVRTASPKIYIYDGSVNPSGDPNITIAQPGLTMYGAEIRHTAEAQTDTGLGDAAWLTIGGATFLAMVSSPGELGLRPGGSFTEDVRHDWYVALSCTPTTLGDKNFGLYFEVEFL
jgi:hypothetical protein